MWCLLIGYTMSLSLDTMEKEMTLNPDARLSFLWRKKRLIFLDFRFEIHVERFVIKLIILFARLRSVIFPIAAFGRLLISNR